MYRRSNWTKFWPNVWHDIPNIWYFLFFFCPAFSYWSRIFCFLSTISVIWQLNSNKRSCCGLLLLEGIMLVAPCHDQPASPWYQPAHTLLINCCCSIHMLGIKVVPHLLSIQQTIHLITAVACTTGLTLELVTHFLLQYLYVFLCVMLVYLF